VKSDRSRLKYENVRESYVTALKNEAAAEIRGESDQFE